MILDCLLKNNITINDLKELFVESIMALASSGRDIDFDSLYNEIVTSRDIEIDVESAAYLYDEVRGDNRITGLSSNIDEYLTTSEDLNDMINGEVGRHLSKVGVAVNSKERTIKYNPVNPARSIAISLMNVLNNKKFRGKVTDSDAVKIKKIIYRFAKGKLAEAKPVGKTVDLLAEALEKSMMSSDFTSTPDQLFEAMKESFKEIASRISNPAIRAQFMHEFGKINDAAFDLGITESARKKILYDVIKNSRFGKTNKAGKKIVNWNALASEPDVEAALREVLDDKLTSLKYTGNRSKVYNALLQNINQVRRASAFQRAIAANTRNASYSAFNNQLGEEVAISNGFFRESGDGRKLVDYSAKNPRGRRKVKDMLLEAGYADDVAERMSQTQDLTSVFETISKNYQKIKSDKSIRDAVRRLMVLNNKRFQRQFNEMDRLVNLMEKGIGLDNITDSISASILGIRIKASHIKEMNEIIREYSEIMKDPASIYAEIAAANPTLGLTFDYNGNIPMGLWASRTLERLNRRMSDLIIDSIANNSSLIKVMYFIERLQNSYLSALLTNVINLPQNVATQFNTIMASGKKVMGEKKMKMFFGLVLLDANGAMSDPKQLHSHFKDWSEAESFIEKVGALYRTVTQGVLYAIDGVGEFYGTRRMFYNGIIEVMKIKGMTDAEINGIMEPFFNDDAMKKSMVLAKYFFDKAGITPQKLGVKRYQRELEAEAMLHQMGLLMGSKELHKIGISAEHIYARMQSAKRLTRFGLGKELSYVTKGVGQERGKDYKTNIPAIHNVVGGMARAQGRKFNNALRAYAENNSRENAINLVWHFFMKMFIHGGPFKFGSGIMTFADMAFGTISPGRWLPALGIDPLSRKKKYKEILSDKTPIDAAKNVDRVIELYEELEINRRKNYLFRVAWATSFLALMGAYALVGEDDEDKNFYEEAVDALYKIGESNPAMKKIITRIGALPLRMMYQLRKTKLSKNKTVAYTQLVATLFNTGPVDMKAAVAEMIDPEWVRSGEPFSLKALSGQFGKMVSTLMFPSPVAALGEIAFGAINFVEDARRGYSLKYNVKESQLAASVLPEDWMPQLRVVNGAIIGQHSQQLNYFLEGHIGVDKSIMKNDKLRNPHDYDALNGEKFSSIDWAEYGSPELNEGKYNVDLAYSRLESIEEKILEIGMELNIPEFNDASVMKNLMKRPYTTMFSVSMKGLDFDAVKRYDPSIKEDDKTVNVALLALKKMGLNLNAKDVENAIKFRNFQESLNGR